MASSDSDVPVDLHVEQVSQGKKDRGLGKPSSRGGRRRGRGRGRGRGRHLSLSASDRERVSKRKEERQRQSKELINDIDTETLREMVLTLVDRQPGLVFDLCESAPAPAPVPGEPAEPQLPTWCKCGNCIDMPTEVERKCCGCTKQHCVSQRLEMDTLVLDQQVLALSNQYRKDVYGLHRLEEDDFNRSMRHAAYRNFILWRHGRLGSGIRRVIPACCVRRIRQAFPDPMSHYTGFVPNRLL